jgi:hypothetical protein
MYANIHNSIIHNNNQTGNNLSTGKQRNIIMQYIHIELNKPEEYQAWVKEIEAKGGITW